MWKKLGRGAFSILVLGLFVWSVLYFFSWSSNYSPPTLVQASILGLIIFFWIFLGFTIWIVIQNRQMDRDCRIEGTENFFEQAKIFSEMFGFNPNIKKQRTLSPEDSNRQNLLIHKTLHELAKNVDHEFQLASVVKSSPGLSLAFNESIAKAIDNFHDAKALAESYGYKTLPDWRSYGPFKKLGT